MWKDKQDRDKQRAFVQHLARRSQIKARARDQLIEIAEHPPTWQNFQGLWNAVGECNVAAIRSMPDNVLSAFCLFADIGIDEACDSALLLLRERDEELSADHA